MYGQAYVGGGGIFDAYWSSEHQSAVLGRQVKLADVFQTCREKRGLLILQSNRWTKPALFTVHILIAEWANCPAFYYLAF